MDSGGQEIISIESAHDDSVALLPRQVPHPDARARPENTRAFAHWRARHGLSLTQAARALGLTARTISAYGTGARPVPRYIALACKGWEVERQGRESPHLTR